MSGFLFFGHITNLVCSEKEQTKLLSGCSLNLLQGFVILSLSKDKTLQKDIAAIPCVKLHFA
jgi:hypothetical protein